MLSEFRTVRPRRGFFPGPGFWIMWFGRTAILNRDGSNLDWHRKKSHGVVIAIAEQGVAQHFARALSTTKLR